MSKQVNSADYRWVEGWVVGSGGVAVDVGEVGFVGPEGLGRVGVVEAGEWAVERIRRDSPFDKLRAGSPRDSGPAHHERGCEGRERKTGGLGTLALRERADDERFCGPP